MFSKQDLIDCVAENSGCYGGTIRNGLDYLKTYGVTLAENYPFIADNGYCDYESKPYVRITDYQELSRQGDPARGIQPAWAQDFVMENALNESPLSATWPNSPSILRFYVRGVLALHPSMHDTPTGHAVVIVGHYSRRPNDCWIIRNSWGADWGMEGHLLVQKRTMGVGFDVYKLTSPMIQLFHSEPRSGPSTPSDDGAGTSYDPDSIDMSRFRISDPYDYSYSSKPSK
nr:PREDICTED: ervatamin-B-like [Bemisia tabaci]